VTGEPAPAGAEPRETTPRAAPAGRPGRSIVPHWVRGNTNVFAMLVTFVAVGLALQVVAWLAPVLAPLGLGLFLAAMVTPLFVWMQGRGASAGVALALTVGLVVVVGALIVWLLLVSAQALGASLGTYAGELEARYGEADPTGTLATLEGLVPPDVLVAILRGVVGIAVDVGSSFAFAVVIAALLLLDAPRLSALVTSGLGSENPVFRETPALAKAAITYIVVRVRVNAVTAVSLLVLMLLVGVDYAPLWAVGAFFLSFVPYLGLVIALIAPTILAFAESGPLAAAVIVIGGVVLNLVAENVLEPTLTGRALSLSTWLVFTMFFVWTWLLGPVGALLSMPITVLLVLVLEPNPRTNWIAALLGRTPATEPASAADGAP
jgi:AI-2 transport protein TqsA